MNGYLGNFFEHAGQITSFAVALAVWLGFGALGAVVGGRGRMPEATPLYGWALASFAFTAVGAFTSLPFTWVAVALAGLAVIEAVVVYRSGDRILPAGSLRIAILALPLLLLVSAMVGSQWDEFADWLMSPRQVLALDRFPDNANKHLGGSLAAYPYGWHIVTYLASRLAGRLVENAGALVNVFLLLSFALAVARLIGEAQGNDPAAKPGWGLLAVCGLLMIAPISQKVSLTSYADVATAVSVGFGVIIGWRMLDALARGAGPDARHLAFEFGLVMLVLVNLKQATVALFGLVIGAVVLAGLRDPNVRVRDLVRLLPAMALPGIVIYAIWRYYVTTNLTGAEMRIQPFGEWLIAEIPQIVRNMLVVLSKKVLYLPVMLVAAAFAIRGLIRCRGPFDRLAIIIGGLFVGYNGFLLFVFVSTFGKFDALRVASLWRYNMHLLPIAAAFAAYGLSMLWPRYAAPRLDGRRLAWLPVVLMVAAPLVFVHKLRFDRHPPVPYFREVGVAVAGMVKPGDNLFVVDPRGSGESGVITRYELKDPGVFRGYLSLYHNADRARFREVFFGRGLNVILVHSSTPPMAEALGREFPAGASYLLRLDGKGEWTVVETWKTRQGKAR